MYLADIIGDPIGDILRSDLLWFLIRSDDFWVFMGVRFAMTFAHKSALNGLSGWCHALLITIIYAMITSQK